ncbi:GDSL esterase/lipase, partial [Mucuna pruriens]
MAAKTKAWLVLSFLVLAGNCMQRCVHGESQVHCIYIFGDSLSDNGNNNNLPTDARVNYRPYGIDFPEGPSGRFTNGRTSIDFISEYLEFKEPIPPYANTSDSDIHKGVNYASGAAGILRESGKHRGPNIHLGEQLTNHRDIYSKIVIKLGGSRKAKQYLSKCLYYVNIGSNDYINNYFLPQKYSTSRIYTPEQYVKILIDQYSKDIQSLRNNGAKKFVLAGLGLLGCTPNAISTQRTNGSCAQEINAAVFSFNDKLKSLVDQFNKKFSDSKFIFINSTVGTLDESLGFTNVNTPCCPSGENGQCIRNKKPCENRKANVFWDEFHTTEAVNRLVALSSYNGSDPSFTYPIDIKRLVQS